MARNYRSILKEESEMKSGSNRLPFLSEQIKKDIQWAEENVFSKQENENGLSVTVRRPV